MVLNHHSFSRNGAHSSLHYAHIVGWGMAVPDKIMTNDDLSVFVETTDEWIYSRTGIRQRYIANDQETTTSLGLKAARRALKTANILPQEVNLIIVATSTPENIFPSTASLIQDQLGAVKAGAFDLSAACSGFVYGLDLAAQAIRSKSIKTALIIGTETMSRILNWQDRATCVLFGDGAGAVVLQGKDEPGGVLASTLGSDGAGCDLLTLPAIGSYDTIDTDSPIHKIDMNGREVFKFATHRVGDVINQTLDKAKLALDDVSLIIPHQANYRIIQSVARSLKLDESFFFSVVDKYANTSAASIPIALCEAIDAKRIQDHHKIVLVGFGAGLTWAATIIDWVYPKVSEKLLHFKPQRRTMSYFLAYWRARSKRLGRKLKLRQGDEYDNVPSA